MDEFIQPILYKIFKIINLPSSEMSSGNWKLFFSRNLYQVYAISQKQISLLVNKNILNPSLRKKLAYCGGPKPPQSPKNCC